MAVAPCGLGLYHGSPVRLALGWHWVGFVNWGIEIKRSVDVLQNPFFCIIWIWYFWQTCSQDLRFGTEVNANE